MSKRTRRPGSMEVRRTNLMSHLELELGTAMTAYLFKQLGKGVSRSALARQLDVHPSTMSVWARKMGYGQRDVLEAGWRSGLIAPARYA